MQRIITLLFVCFLLLFSASTCFAQVHTALTSARFKGPSDYVFSRNDGKPILDFRGSWDTLCAAAKLNGLLFHDLRRSAVRNMIRAGVPERVAMEISGHKIRSVFEHYNIVSESDLVDAARKIEASQTKVLAESARNNHCTKQHSPT